MSFLKAHNPLINWTTGNISFDDNTTHTQASVLARSPDISTMHANAFARLVNKAAGRTAKGRKPRGTRTPDPSTESVSFYLCTLYYHRSTDFS